jgi:hypothetical protein
MPWYARRFIFVAPDMGIVGAVWSIIAECLIYSQPFASSDVIFLPFVQTSTICKDLGEGRLCVFCYIRSTIECFTEIFIRPVFTVIKGITVLRWGDASGLILAQIFLLCTRTVIFI